MRQILNLIPHDAKYVEVFSTLPSLIFAKYPSGFECYNDLDKRLYNLYCILRNEEQYEQFVKLCNDVQYNRQSFDHALQIVDSGDEMFRAVNFWIIARMTFEKYSGIHNSISPVLVENAYKYLPNIDVLPDFHLRMQRVQIECQDWEMILRRYDSKNALFFVCPPESIDFNALVKAMNNVEGRIILLCKQEHKDLNKWTRIKFESDDLVDKSDYWIWINYNTNVNSSGQGFLF